MAGSPWLPAPLSSELIDLYHEQRVIGGPGAFMVVAEHDTSFDSAILGKVLLEIAGEGL